MKWLAALFTLLALAAGSAHATPAQDVLGRPVPIGDGRPTLVFYTNRDTQAALHDTAFPFTFQLRREKPLVVVRFDLSDVPSLLRGAAKGEIRKAERDSVAAMARLFRQHGLTPPPRLADSLYMVADSDGQPRRAVGLQKHFRQPFAQALDTDGHELAKGPFPQDASRLAHAIRTHAPLAEAQR